MCLTNCFIDYPLIALNLLDSFEPPGHTIFNPLDLIIPYKTVSETEEDNLWFLTDTQSIGHFHVVTLSSTSAHEKGGARNSAVN